MEHTATKSCPSAQTPKFILDRTKTRHGSKNGSIKLEICSPSGGGKSFHGRGLLSALVTRTSMQVSPPCVAEHYRKTNDTRHVGLVLHRGGLGMRLGEVSPVVLV